MNTKIRATSVFLFALLLITSCGSSRKSGNTDNSVKDTVEIKYAKGFDISSYEHYKKITVSNLSEQGHTQQTIYLADNKDVATPDDGLKIVVPIGKIAVASVTYYGFLAALGELETVKGICSPDIAYNKYITDGYKSGAIANLGDSFSPDLEKLVVLHPDIFMLPSYQQQDEMIKRLQNAGIPFVFNNEWMETSPLARTEWIKFVAAFYNKSAEADSIFDQIESRYLEAKKTAASATDKPTVLMNANFKGTWYMPGGKSYVANLVADAGGDYFYKNDTTVGSLALSFETVLKNFNSADVWLNVPVGSMAELLAMEQRHNLFKPTKTGNVFSFMGRYLPSSANDYWETALVEPDVVLKDIIWALHPSLLPDYKPVYIQKVAISK